MRRAVLLLLVGSALAAATRPGYAQLGGAALQFNFSNPGARSLGLGGAFASLADDATAAFANPAGLVQLVRPEVSIETRLWQHSTPFVAGGRVSGEPTGILLDDTSDLRFGEDQSDLTGVSFLSFVYPLKRGCLAFFQYQLANFEVASETRGLFGAGSGGGTERRDESRQHTDFKTVSYGVAGALRLSEKLDVGLALVYSDGDLGIVQEEYNVDGGTLESPFAPLPLTPENLESRTIFGGGDGSDWSLNAGVLWQVTDQLRVGGFFRQGPGFTTEITRTAGPAFEDFLATPGQAFAEGTTTTAIPDVFGLGIAYRTAGDALTLSFEWDHVEYSDLLEALNPEIFDRAELSLDDGDEVHLGFEYVFLRTGPLVAVRAGWWHDPAHQIRSLSPDPFERAIFRGGEDADHYTAGVGVRLRSLQIDLGVDLSDFVDVVALSGIYSF